MMERIPSPDASLLPARTATLAAVSAILWQFTDSEIGSVGLSLTAPVWYTIAQDWLERTKDSPPASTHSLNNMKCRVILEVGRESGTFMPKEWGSSGTRLAVPLSVRFSDDVVDMGIGEETLNPSSGGRYAKRLYCDDRGGPVRSTGGAWSAQPSDVRGARSLNFFLDFPEGATRDDVTLPAGRVFFSCACWDSEDALPRGMLTGDCPMPQLPGGGSALDAEPAGVVSGPGGVQLLDKGGLSIKRSDARNLWGWFGEGFFTLGRFRVTEPL